MSDFQGAVHIYFLFANFAANKQLENVENMKESLWKTTCNRFVAFLDIMGFTEMVAREDHHTIYKMLGKIVALIDAVEDYNPNDYIYVTVFSDSIIIFSKDDSEESYKNFILSLTYLFSGTINDSIPIKGACAFGKITIDKKKKLFFGQALIDAHLLQEDVHYYGMVCHYSFDAQVKNYSKVGFAERLLFTSKSCLKSGDITHTNVAWFRSLTDKDLNLNGVTRALELMSCKVSGKPKKYIDNTLEMYSRYKKYIELKK